MQKEDESMDEDEKEELHVTGLVEGLYPELDELLRSPLHDSVAGRMIIAHENDGSLVASVWPRAAGYARLRDAFTKSLGRETTEAMIDMCEAFDRPDDLPIVVVTEEGGVHVRRIGWTNTPPGSA